MDSKQFRRVEVKAGDRGQVEAVFATLNVVDLDGDVTLPGAFPSGKEVPISAYNHTSWSGAMPVGKGTIRETGTEAILTGQFFMDTTAGRDTFNVVKHMGAKGQWSYGYDVLDAAPGVVDGADVQLLKSLDVHEVSPVLLGAGINTRTIDAKSAGAGSHKEGLIVPAFRAIKAHETPTVTKAWDVRAAVDAVPDGAGVSDLRTVFALVDGDPEAKSSYGFAHHHGVGGAANLRACVLGVARLNDPKGKALGDEDRKAVYEHLVSHLRDADYEPLPDLRTGAEGLKLHDELAVALAGVADARESASRVVALRAEKGKYLSRVNVELLDWLNDELRELRSQIDTPADDLAREYVRFVASQIGA